METDKNYKNFVSLDFKEQNTILQSLKVQVLGTSFDSKLISKWSFLKNILDLDNTLIMPTISNQKLVKSENSSMIKIQDQPK